VADAPTPEDGVRRHGRHRDAAGCAH